MSGNSTVLMRRIGVKSEKVKIGLFRSDVRLVLDGECGDDDVLCAFRNNGDNARVLTVGKDGTFSGGQSPQDGDMLFAVRRTPFKFGMRISAGTDADNNRWVYDVHGQAEISNPTKFAVKFRGDVSYGKSLFVDQLGVELGTIPATTMHDRVLCDVLGVMALQDRVEKEQEAANNARYVDMQYRLEESREVGENLVSEAWSNAFTSFFDGIKNVVSMTVRSFHAFSKDREAKLTADEQIDVKIRNDAAHIAALQHDLEVAKLNNETATIEADTEELKAKAKKFFANAEAIDRLMNMNFREGNEFNLEKVLALAGKEDSVGTIMSVANSLSRVDSPVKLEIESSIQTRAVGPRRKVMKQGGCYSLKVGVPRDGHLTVLDICDGNAIVPLVPCVDSKTKSAFVLAGKTVAFGHSDSPWYQDAFEQYNGSGMDRFVAFITDEPLLSTEESVPFGDELPADSIRILAERLSKLKPGSASGGLLQVRIESSR